ncbi:dienelactone hydrolase [Shewanella sp. OPT22]|nr:dienelactone hydrolase [Shewanella sp. OPT22]
MIAYEVDGDVSDTLVIFAHGAGAGMDSDFMQQVSAKLAAKQVQVVRFNFNYMQINKDEGKRRPPERMPKLIAHFEELIAEVVAKYQPKHLYLMGKSMGGRVAAILCEQSTFDIKGVICLGYPFISIKGGNPRLEPLEKCQVPVHIIQGERDRFGSQQQVRDWILPSYVTFSWVPDGDHSFEPRKRSGHNLEQNLDLSIDQVMGFIGEKNA